MCGPLFSTKWYEDSETLGWKKLPKTLSCVNNFEQWLEDHKDNLIDLKFAYFAGGEPMVQDEHYQFLQFLIDNGITNVELTPELAAQALQDIAGKEPKTASISPRLIIEAVVDSFHLTPLALKSRKRDKETALARQAAMYLFRQETDWSLTRIGEELGGRSPATVSHAYETITNDINNSPYLRRKISDIQQKIYSKQAGTDY